MSRAEVENLSDEDLLKEWEEIKVAYKMHLPQHLSDKQYNVLFANFVNVSSEITKRNLKNSCLQSK